MKWNERLKQARLEAGLTQAEVARRLGYKEYTAYSQYELGKRVPSLELAARMADVLGISLDWLTGRVN